MKETGLGQTISLALATRNTEFYANRVFDADEIARMGPTLPTMALPWLAVHTEAARRGIDMVTADRVTSPAETTLIAYDWTPDAQLLVQKGAHPGALDSS